MSNQPPTMTSSQASDSASQPALPWMKTHPLVEVSACRGFSCCSLPSVISFHTFIIRPLPVARAAALAFRVAAHRFLCPAAMRRRAAGLTMRLGAAVAAAGARGACGMALYLPMSGKTGL
jgi:hypothetical protein